MSKGIEFIEFDDDLDNLINALRRPIFNYNMARAMLFKHHDSSASARSAPKRYENARNDIINLLTEYQNKVKGRSI